MRDSLRLLLPTLWVLASSAPLATGGPSPRPQASPGLQEKDQGEEELTPLERARRELEKRRATEEPLIGPDGAPVLPGQLPAGVSEEARRRWQALEGAVLATKPIDSFSLEFYLRQRDPERPKSNDAKLIFRFLAPDWLRAELDSGRAHLRGPEGDFVIDKERTIPIPVGREGAEDRRQLDEMAAIARNFVALTDPRTLRITTLELLEAPPSELPGDLVEEGGKLDWLLVKSPDFHLYREASTSAEAGLPIYAARLGVDGASGEIRLAAIHRDRAEAGREPETARLVRLSDYHRRDGFLVPHRVEIRDPDRRTKPWRFRNMPTSELTLRRSVGRLGAGLLPEDFVPE